MIGTFDVLLTGVETIQSRDGKDTFFYANFLQNNEIKRVKVKDAGMFAELAKLPSLSKVIADFDVSATLWEGKTYLNFKLISYEIESKKSS